MIYTIADLQSLLFHLLLHGYFRKETIMAIMKVFLLAIALVALAMVGLAIRILLKKGGQFPNTHVGGNKNMRERGIYCAQTLDKIEQSKAKKELKYKDLTLIRK